jgi:putative sugar O-methyltransferase
MGSDCNAIEDCLPLLDEMMEDLRKQRGVYRISEYWERYSKRVCNELGKNSLRDFRSNARILKGYGDVLLHDPMDLACQNNWKERVHSLIVNLNFVKTHIRHPYLSRIKELTNEASHYKSLYYDKIFGSWFKEFSSKYELPYTMGESPNNVVRINEEEVSTNYLKMFLRVHNFQQRIEFEGVHSVLEIGGGFGSLCHTILTMFPQVKKYVYVDVPPGLYLGTQYLKKFYGANVIDYQKNKNLDKISFSNNDELEIMCICPWQLDKLDAAVDLVWNSHSFQEMNCDIIKNYATILKRLSEQSRDLVMSLVMYKETNSPTTVKQQDILAILDAECSVKFDKIDALLDVYENSYYVGTCSGKQVD